MKIGLYFGSFNPIHVGHLIIANHVLAHTDVKKIWFIVSPQNPLKEEKSLLNEYHRLHLVQLAIENQPLFKASKVEFSLPKPSYTIDTLTYLKEQYPKNEFAVIMGGDSFQNIKKWKNYNTLLQQYELMVYNRPNFKTEAVAEAKKITLLDAPLLDISASYIRKEIQAGRSVQFLLSKEVEEYIKENRYYK